MTATVTGLAVTGLEKSYGDVPVLRGIDLTVPAGSLTAILGPSGCGKTTFLRLVAGFDHADAGRIQIGDRVAGDAGEGVFLPPERRRVGYVAQEGALFPHLSVAANVAFGLSRAARRGPRIDELLELVGMGGLGERMPHELSGGQQQRVALARALAPNPSLVLLDEPFAALDAGLRATVRADVQAALSAAGATTVLVTHDQAEALSMADQVAVLSAGRLLQTAAPTTLYQSPVDPALAEFLGEAVLLPATVAQGVATCVLGALPVQSGDGVTDGPATVMIRPEQIHLRPGGEGAPAEVVDTIYYGHDATVEFRLRQHSGAAGAPRLIARVPGSATPVSGTEVRVSVAGPVLAYAHSQQAVSADQGDRRTR